MNAVLTDDERRALMVRYGSNATPDENNDYMTGDYPLVCAAESAVLAKLREQEPQDRERWLAVREGHFNAASAEYFNARQHLDTPENRRIFYAGHCKGYDAAPQPAVVQVPLTQSQAEIILGHGLENLSEADMKRLMAKAQDRLDRLMESRAALAAPQPAVVRVPSRCPLCNYQHGHQIGCENNPVDIRLSPAAAPEAPATAEVQFPDVQDMLESLAADIECIGVMYRGSPSYEHDAHWMRAAAAKAVRDLAAKYRAPEAPALPAEVREALKEAREALGKVDTACRLIPEDLEGYLEPLSDALSDARAALARIDALGGGQ